MTEPATDAEEVAFARYLRDGIAAAQELDQAIQASALTNMRAGYQAVADRLLAAWEAYGGGDG
jgi:predicted phage gp36 major capsid-like protein